MSRLKKFLTVILELLFPNECIYCSAPDTALCERCMSKIDRPENDVRGVFVCYSYRDPIIRKAIWFLKYKNRRTLAAPLSGMMADFIIEEIADEQLFGNTSKVLIACIPQSKKRTRMRGYNQSELLAQGVAERTGIDFSAGALIKVRETRRQVEVRDRKSRLENLKDSFWVSSPSEIRGKTIIVIDDVVTTGATFAEAKRSLKLAGARRVIACALAH